MNKMTKIHIFWPTVWIVLGFFPPEKLKKNFFLLNSAALRGDSTQKKGIMGLVPDPSSTVQENKEDSWVQYNY